jgi:hypothetical protein
MNAKQIDPKYHVECGSAGMALNHCIVMTSNGQPIPEDEPLILFRARDRHALDTLMHYRDLCELDECTEYHLQGIEDRIAAFQQFASEHPERMKQPGITLGQ